MASSCSSLHKNGILVIEALDSKEHRHRYRHRHMIWLSWIHSSINAHLPPAFFSLENFNFSNYCERVTKNREKNRSHSKCKAAIIGHKTACKSQMFTQLIKGWVWNLKWANVCSLFSGHIETQMKWSIEQHFNWNSIETHNKSLC